QKQRSAQEGRRAMLDLAAKFETSVGGIVEGVVAKATELQGTAQAMAATAELSAASREIAEQVTQSGGLIDEAVQQANVSNEQVKGLTAAAERIGDVVKTIAAIAGQTNLLALNATIEAARAGDAGRGFAVVASEVKALATQTAKATEEISSQIAEVQSATKQAVDNVGAIASIMDEIDRFTAAIADAVSQQNAATSEISR